MDPLSISAGIVGILSGSVTVASQLKKLIDGASTANLAVSSLLEEVEDFSNVLKLMRETVSDLSAEQQTVGHIGNHWSNLSTSIQDGQATIEKLQATVERINKSVMVLDSARKYVRLQSASAEMGIYQQQIRSYKDTMYLSLQAIIL
jgi:methyl-accepting chemotaxis protein